MKLHELFDTKQREKTVSKDSSLDKGLRPKANRRLGAGVFGQAVNHKTDPHLVKKFNKYPQPINRDGYYAYIKAIVDNKIAQENPYAPRVYKIDTIKGNQDWEDVHGKPYKRHRYNIDLERLFPMDEGKASPEELHSIYRAITGRDQYDMSDQEWSFHSNKPKPRDDIQHKNNHETDLEFEDRTINDSSWLATEIAVFVGDIVRGSRKSVDDNLNELCQFIHSIAKSGGYQIDIHSGNLMIRRSNAGVQLVIVDPIA